MYKRIAAVVKKILHRLRKPKAIGLIVGILLVVGGIIWWYRINQSPAEGIINNGITPSQEPSTTAQTTTVFEGKTITFAHDAKYTAKKVQPNKAYLGQVTLNRQKEALHGSSSISVSVRNMQGNNALEEESAYVLRKNNPSKYAQKQTVIKGKTFIVFENPTDEQKELIAFIKNDTKKILAIISMTTTEISFEELSKEFNSLLESFLWK